MAEDGKHATSTIKPDESIKPAFQFGGSNTPLTTSQAEFSFHLGKPHVTHKITAKRRATPRPSPQEATEEEYALKSSILKSESSVQKAELPQSPSSAFGFGGAKRKEGASSSGAVGFFLGAQYTKSAFFKDSEKTETPIKPAFRFGIRNAANIHLDGPFSFQPAHPHPERKLSIRKSCSVDHVVVPPTISAIPYPEDPAAIQASHLEYKSRLPAAESESSFFNSKEASKTADHGAEQLEKLMASMRLISVGPPLTTKSVGSLPAPLVEPKDPVNPTRLAELTAEILDRGEIFDRVLAHLSRGDLIRCLVASRDTFVAVTKYMYHSVSEKTLKDLLRKEELTITQQRYLHCIRFVGPVKPETSLLAQLQQDPNDGTLGRIVQFSISYRKHDMDVQIHVHRYLSQAIVRIRRVDGGSSDRWESLFARRASRREALAGVVRHVGSRSIVGCYLDFGLPDSWTGCLSVQDVHTVMLDSFALQSVYKSSIDANFAQDLSIGHIWKEHSTVIKHLRQYRNLDAKLDQNRLIKLLAAFVSLDSLATSFARSISAVEAHKTLSTRRLNLRFLAIGAWDTIQSANFLLKMLESPFACLTSMRVATDWIALSTATREYDKQHSGVTPALPGSFALSSLETLHIYMVSKDRPVIASEICRWLVDRLPAHVELYIYDGGDTKKNQHRDMLQSYCYPGVKKGKKGWQKMQSAFKFDGAVDNI